MMCSETVIQLYDELFVGAFKLQRQKYNLSHEVKGMILCDAFTGSHAASGGAEQRRLRFASVANVILPLSQPGGWSSAGQPCDQVFNHFKQRCRKATDDYLGLTESFFNRPKYETLQLGPTGFSAFASLYNSFVKKSKCLFSFR